MTFIGLWGCVSNCNIAPKASCIDQDQIKPTPQRLSTSERRALSRKVHSLSTPGGNNDGSETWGISSSISGSISGSNSDRNVQRRVPSMGPESAQDRVRSRVRRTTSIANPQVMVTMDSEGGVVKRVDTSMSSEALSCALDPDSPGVSPTSPVTRHISRRGMPRTRTTSLKEDHRRVSFGEEDESAVQVVSIDEEPPEC
mmetsp:Transcript_6716/g.17135  ORF Transcript_6716/g.17135 Transcript_6716/m.17135 type:complete len:199 (-) Transcript_6716:87-683(-)